MMDNKTVIREITLIKDNKSRAAFSIFHIFCALELISKKQIGRTHLAKKIGIGKGTVLSLISGLKKRDLIKTNQGRAELTEKGLEIWAQLEKALPIRTTIPKIEFLPTKFNYAFVVVNSGNKIKSSSELRDIAIISGAKIAITIINIEGKLVIESVSLDIENDFPQAYKEIQKFFDTKNNDVIVMTGADTSLAAKRSAFAISWLLIDTN